MKKKVHAEAQRRRGGGRDGTKRGSSPPSLSAPLRLCVGMLLFGSTVLAQVPDPPDNFVTENNSTGVAAFTSYTGLRENINLDNLNLNIIIPLITLRGRNGLDVTVVAHYNSIQREWVETTSGPLGETTCDLQGIAEAGAQEFAIQIEPRLTYEAGELTSTTPFPRRHRYVLREADGTRYEFRLRDNDADEYNQNIWTLAGRFRSTGSSHMSLQEVLQPDGSYDATVHLPDGHRILFEPAFNGRGNQQVQAVQDSNGNQITYQWSAGQVTKLVDTLGREVRHSFDAPSGTTTVEVDTSSGQTLTWVLTETELTLPNGLSWRFEWDFEGPFTDPCEASQSRTDKRLVRIYYPSGGSTRYEWTVPPLPNNTMTLLHKKHLCDRTDGLACTTAQEQTYTYLRDYPGNLTQVTRPDGTYSRHHFMPFALLDGEEKEVLTERFSDAGVLLSSVEQDWDIYGRDPKVVEVREKLHDTGGAPLVKRRVMTYDEDGYARPGRDLSTGNLVRLEEYAWGDNVAGPLLRRTENDYLSNTTYGVESGAYILNRLTRTQIFDAVGELASQTDFFYDEYTAVGSFSRNLISVSPIQHDAGYSAFFLTRGNLSRRVNWLNTGEGDPVTLYRYDTAGNLRRLRDPNSKDSITDYSSSTEFAYPSSTTNALGHVESFQYDYNTTFDRGFGGLTSRTEPNGRTTAMTRDILGRVIRVDYPDGGVERRYFSDLQASAVHHQTGQPVFPEQTQLPLRTKSYTLIESSPFLEREAFSVADGLARPFLQGVRNGLDMDWSRTEYDGNERVFRQSSPMTVSYDGSVPTLSFSLWTTSSYDGLGRAVEVEGPDLQSVATAYSGNRTTVTDQVGAARRSITDALGRLVEVREPDSSSGSLVSGNYTDTRYSYDPLDNLTGVLQGADSNDQDGGGAGPSQSRSFLYDSLGRLREESHPESGTARYGYDANGNLTDNIDSRGRRADYDYDELNRIKSSSYSIDGDPSRTDPTPPVSYFYDGSTSLNRRGRLRSVTDGEGTSTYEYDPMGRISRSVRTTHGKTLTADYAYTLLGGLKTATYQGISAPSFSLIYGYDSQGRQASLTDGFNSYVTSYSFEYDSQGAVERTFYGNGTQERISYNSRLQPVGRSVLNPSSQLLMDLSYSFAHPQGSGNNGNVYRIDDLLTGQGRSFSYDRLNRLTGVEGPSAAWSISYSYDRFGNRLMAVGSSSPPNFQNSVLTVDPSTNRIASPGWEYDSAGNVIEDGGAHHFVWDSIGRLIGMGPPQPSTSGPPGNDGRCTVPPCPPPPPPPPDPPPPLDDGRSSLPSGLKGQSVETVSYEYDYQGRRVVKDEGGTGRLYFWDEVLGEVIWEFPLENPSSQDLVRFFVNGRLVAESDARPGTGFHFMHRDHLGTSKLMTDFFSATVVCDEVYHPFGQVQSSQPSGCNSHVRKFTGKERDQESGLDYFGARYCSPFEGRFLSTDPALESATAIDPQTWNRFSYTSNNPMNRVDPDGRRWFFKEGEDPVWVDPNEDGSFTAPGDGWEPVEGQLVLTRGSTVFFYNADNPRVYTDGPLEDDTDSLILAGQLAKGAGQLFRGLVRRGGASARPPSGFSGRKGFELENAAYQKIRNEATTIGKRRFSGHALDQMQNRGIPPSVVENTIKTGKTFPGNAGSNTIGYYDPINKISVFTNATNGTVVTVRYGVP